ncbi:MAG TPA: peptidoglycan DD-metalloendopeptidase family protein [Dehalococcoidia bacterium]|jgi:murein DD-endopeptidase MepM/ murein hydrolase activator NlpD|nr:peptidoglycan DD-metalloendopeptidase family protein [Dehalococcoidia bacterium]
MPTRTPSRASSLINPAEGLSYSGVVSPSQNTGQSLRVAVGNPSIVQSPGNAAPSGGAVNAGLADRQNQSDILSAGLQVPNLLSPLTLTSSECDTSQSDKYCVYTVKEGDTLSSIASNAGLKTTEDVANWELLVHSNKPDIVSEDDLLQVGQKLRIPRGQGVVHTVLSAETLSDLAGQFDVAVEDILQANNITDANTLAIGDELLIPNPKQFALPIIIEEDAPGGGSSGPQIVGGGARSNVGFIWPTSGSISSYFSPGHPLGIDIDLFGRGGSPIAAVKAGTVTFAGGNPCCSYGYYIVIDHGDGYQTLYAHLSGIEVSQGQRVAQGQLIGYGGSTGYSTGTHLHFEVHRNGSIVNPLNYLP